MYLRIEDYYNLIASENLTVIQNQASYRRDAELAAQEEISSYLRHRYSTELIFKGIQSFALANTYSIGDLIEYTETAYSSTSTYLLGARCVYDGNIYECSTAITAPEAWTTGHWSLISADKLLYYAVAQTVNKYPDEHIAVYTTGDYVTNAEQITGWDGATVTLYCKKPSTGSIFIYGSDADRTAGANAITSITYTEAGLVLPYNAEIGASTTLGGWLTIKNFIPDGTTFNISLSKAWVQGDNRNPKIKQIVMDVALYELHKRINPRNIPDLRIEAKDSAISWLGKISKGQLVVDLPLKANKEAGKLIEYGSDQQIY